MFIAPILGIFIAAANRRKVPAAHVAIARLLWVKQLLHLPVVLVLPLISMCVKLNHKISLVQPSFCRAGGSILHSYRHESTMGYLARHGHYNAPRGGGGNFRKNYPLMYWKLHE